MLGVYKAISKAPDLAVLGLNGSGQKAAVFGGVLVSCLQGCFSVSDVHRQQGVPFFSAAVSN